LVFFSARVGSINDNLLGGWYGYRASKAALNMLLKSAQVECQRRAKNISLVSYHPGTVDTELSRPFQANVPKDKLFSSEFTVSQLLQFVTNLLAEDGPHYIDWQGKTIPW
jgi:NAD(P)-dependent dehydrogenase (short-subunit alcohol dehydrogenase family)